MFCCCYVRHSCLLCSVAVTLDTHVCSLLIQLAFKLCLTAFPPVDAKRLLKPVYPAVCRGIQVVLRFLGCDCRFLVGGKKPILLFSSICFF